MRLAICNCFPQYNCTHQKFKEKLCPQLHGGRAAPAPHMRRTHRLTPLAFAPPRALRFTVKTQGFAHFLTFKLPHYPTPATFFTFNLAHYPTPATWLSYCELPLDYSTTGLIYCELPLDYSTTWLSYCELPLDYSTTWLSYHCELPLDYSTTWLSYPIVRNYGSF